MDQHPPGIAERTPYFRASYEAVVRTPGDTPNGLPMSDGSSSIYWGQAWVDGYVVKFTYLYRGIKRVTVEVDNSLT